LLLTNLTNLKNNRPNFSIAFIAVSESLIQLISPLIKHILADSFSAMRRKNQVDLNKSEIVPEQASNGEFRKWKFIVNYEDLELNG
jgi:hypothetical protein